MLKAVSRSQPRYHSPTIWPLRITSKPVLPRLSALNFQASASLSQSTPVAERILAFCSASGSPLSGSRLSPAALRLGRGIVVGQFGLAGRFGGAVAPANTPRHRTAIQSRVRTAVLRSVGIFGAKPRDGPGANQGCIDCRPVV